MGVNSEALAIAGRLIDMANLYEREAAGWKDYPRVAARCRDAIGQITDAARYVIATEDLTWGEAWISEAVATLEHLQLTRLFRDGTAWVRLTIH